MSPPFPGRASAGALMPLLRRLYERSSAVSSLLDFADPRRYPPQGFRGLVVLRLTTPTTRNQVTCLTRFFADNPEVAGHLWIVEDTRARDWTP
jgi:hypothetical protein